MARIVQALTQPGEQYDQQLQQSFVRDVDSVIQKLNSTFQQDLKDELEAVNFYSIMANTFVNKKADLTSNSATTLYTVPTATTAVIKSILVSEDSGNADTITVTITDTDDAVFSLFKTKAISANATSELLSQPLVVAESEIVKVTAATANRLHVVLSALEIKKRDVTT